MAWSLNYKYNDPIKTKLNPSTICCCFMMFMLIHGKFHRAIVFLFFFKIFVGPRSILWGHWLPLFWTSCDPPYGFQSQGSSLASTLTCLHVVNLRVTSGATPAFSRCTESLNTAKLLSPNGYVYVRTFLSSIFCTNGIPEKLHILYCSSWENLPAMKWDQIKAGMHDIIMNDISRASEWNQ